MVLGRLVVVFLYVHATKKMYVGKTIRGFSYNEKWVHLFECHSLAFMSTYHFSDIKSEITI